MKPKARIPVHFLLGLVIATGTFVVFPADASQTASSGEDLYENNCSGCHMPNGEGVGQNFPKLVGAPLVVGDPKGVIAVVINGRGTSMPSASPLMSDVEVAAVVNFIRNAWGNKATPVTVNQVAAVRATIE